MDDKIAEQILAELQTLNTKLESIDDTMIKGGKFLFSHLGNIAEQIDGIKE